MKKILFWLASSFFILWLFSQTLPVFAQGTQIEVIPNAPLPMTWWQSGQLENAHDRIIDTDWKVRTEYNKEVKKLTTAQQITSWIMTWDTLLDYWQNILIFLSQAWIAMGGLMFIYVGYQYIMSIIGWESPKKSLITNAIIGILVIIFSYAIMRILTRTFLA